MNQNKSEKKQSSQEEIMFQQNLVRTRQRIERQNNLAFEELKKEFTKHPALDVKTEEERKRDRKRLLKYVHKYVFLQKLEPIDNSSVEAINAFNKDLKNRDLLKKILLFRNVFSRFFRLKSVIILSSAFFFFFIEYYLHYYSSFSFKDINVTFEDIITKIPPFC